VEIDFPAVLTVVLTSAAVGAVVSQLITLIAQHLERKARRTEFLMKTATDWAVKRVELAIEFAKTRTVYPVTPDLGWMAYDYHQQLSSLMRDGTMPPDMRKSSVDWSKGINVYSDQEGRH
jgi:hypothetical protein